MMDFRSQQNTLMWNPSCIAGLRTIPVEPEDSGRTRFLTTTSPVGVDVDAGAE